MLDFISIIKVTDLINTISLEVGISLDTDKVNIILNIIKSYKYRDIELNASIILA